MPLPTPCDVTGCKRELGNWSKVHCDLHRHRLKRFGQTFGPGLLSNYGKPADERFWMKVKKTDACWLWIAALDKDGYGLFTPVHRASDRAHRFAYELLVGKIPDGLVIDHLCRVKNCVNPAHLEPVTMTVNSSRSGAWEVNRAKTHCPKGHPYDAVNTMNKKKGRDCRACHRKRNREAYHAKKLNRL